MHRSIAQVRVNNVDGLCTRPCHSYRDEYIHDFLMNQWLPVGMGMEYVFEMPVSHVRRARQQRVDAGGDGVLTKTSEIRTFR